MPLINVDDFNALAGNTLVAAPLNQIIRSQELNNAAWTLGTANVAITANATTAPDSTATADKIIEANTTSSIRQIFQTNVSVVGSTTYTVSFYAKAAERSVVFSAPNSTHFSSTSGAIFDLSTGLVTKESTTIKASMISIGDGWWRCQYTSLCNTTSAASTLEFRIHTPFAAYTGVVNSGLYVWGVQMEIGSSATKYIPTTTAVAGPAENIAGFLWGIGYGDRGYGQRTLDTNLVRNLLIATDSTRSGYPGWDRTGIGPDNPRTVLYNSSLSVTGSTIYTFSCIYYSSDGNVGNVFLKFDDASGWPESSSHIQPFQLHGGGSMTPNSVWISRRTVDLGNNFKFLSGTFQTLSTTTALQQIFFDADNAGVIVFVADVQFELGSRASEPLAIKSPQINIKQEWLDLRNTISSIATWQNTSQASLTAANLLDAGDIIASSHESSMETLLATLDTNRLNYQAGNMTLTSSAASSTRSTTWGSGSTGITCTFQVVFASEAAARYFFNTGGDIRIALAHPSTSSARNSSWNTVLNNLVVQFKANTTVRLTGTTGTAQAIGYYQLTTTFQTIHDGTNSGVSPYTSNDYSVEARTTAITGENGAKGTTLQFRVTLTDSQTNAFSDTVASGTNAVLSHLRATNSIVVTAPTCSVTTGF